MTNKTRSLLIFGSVGLLIAGLTVNKLFFSASPAVANRSGGGGPLTAEGFVVQPVEYEPFEESVGTLHPMEESVLRAEIPGRITAIHFKDGQSVQEGQLLAELYNEDIKAEILRIEAQLEVAQSTAERVKSLYAAQTASKQELDEALAQVKILEANLTGQKARLEQTRIRAPFSGTVGLRQISVGTFLNAGAEILTIRQTHQLKLDFYTPEYLGHKIRTGQDVYWWADALEITGEATISAIEPALEAGTRSLKIRAVINNPANGLLPGNFLRVRIPLDQDQNPLLVPSHAVIPEIRGYKVIRCVDGKVAPAPVEIGIRNDSLVEIRRGVQSGDTILLTGLLQAKPGQDIQFSRILQTKGQP